MNKKNIIYIIILLSSIAFFIFSLTIFINKFKRKKNPNIKKKIEYVDSNLVFEDLTHDFGLLYEGDLVYHDFYFYNEGDKKIDIIKVKTSCGCTSVEHPKYLKPDKRGKIRIKYNTTSRTGNTHATVHIITNSKSSKKTTINIFAKIKPSLLFNPPVTLFYKVEESGDQTKTLQIKADSSADYDFKIKKIKKTVDFVSVDYKQIKKNYFEVYLNLDSQKTIDYYNKRVDEIKKNNPRYKAPPHKKIGGTLQIEFKSKDKRKITYYFYASLNQ